MGNVKVDSRFPKQIIATLILSAVVAAYPLFRFSSPDVIKSVIAGAFLSTVNVLLGYLAIEYSFGKSYSTFLKTVLGGMGVRMALLLAALVALIRVFGFHAVGLTVSMLTFYVIYLILEVLFIQRKMIAKNQG